MNKKTTQKNIKIDDLILDHKNPRFADLYSGSNDQNELIQYLLFSESAEDIAKNIVNKDSYYSDELLWVIEKGNKFLVKDGNRRCAAVKALRQTNKYDLKLKSKKIDELPALIFQDKDYLSQRIREKHVSPLFKGWDRIAKSIEAYRQFENNTSLEELKSIDSSPKDLIKLASFYREAVKIKKDDFKKLLRKGRGAQGGKIIVFERMFKHCIDCGYYFQNKPKFTIKIRDEEKFQSYIKAMVEYLIAHPELSSRKMDNKNFSLEELKNYGFDTSNSTDEKSDPKVEDANNEIFGSTQENPPSSLEKYLIPKNISLSINSTKINNIYRELKYSLPINNSRKAVPNAVGVLFRVFLEISIDYFIEKVEIEMPKDTRGIGKKIEKICKYMETEKIASKKQLEDIETVFRDKDHLLYIKNFHAYIHSSRVQPTTSDLKTQWTNLQDFFIILWKHLEDQNKK